MYNCKKCKKSFSSEVLYDAHVADGQHIASINQAFNNALTTFRLTDTIGEEGDFLLFCAKVRSLLETKTRSQLEKMNNLKMALSVRVVMHRHIEGQTLVQEIRPTFNTNPLPIRNSAKIVEIADGFFAELERKIQDFLRRGSGWHLEKILFFGCCIFTTN